MERDGEPLEVARKLGDPLDGDAAGCDRLHGPTRGGVHNARSQAINALPSSRYNAGDCYSAYSAVSRWAPGACFHPNGGEANENATLLATALTGCAAAPPMMARMEPVTAAGQDVRFKNGTPIVFSRGEHFDVAVSPRGGPTGRYRVEQRLANDGRGSEPL